MASRRLRIAVWHNVPSGGAKRALHDHVRGLSQRGHHLEVWCPPQADRDYLPLSDYAVEHVVALDVTPARPQRALFRVGIGSRQRTLWRRFDEHCRAVARAIGEDFDVVFTATSQFVAVPPLAAHTALPTVLYLQEPNRPLYEAMPVLPWVAGGRDAREAAVAARAERAAIEAFDRVLVNSRFSRENVLRAFGADATVCYLGVDTTLFQPALDASRDYFVGLGAISRAKGIETVLDALAESGARAPLVWAANIVESEMYVTHVEAKARALGLEVELRRRVPDHELVALLQHARALLYAPRLEPFGYAPLESSACGTPVIGVAEGGVRESVLDGVNGLLVDPGEFADAIDRVWDDRAAADALGAAARTHVLEHWSLDAAVDRLERELVAAAANPRGRD